MGVNEKHGNIKCWECMGCGREKGGKNVDELGICPAYPDHGRFCWDVVGTLCGGEVQGTMAKKKDACLNCEFFLRVRWEEKDDFVFLEI
jgi:hypothetical protein